MAKEQYYNASSYSPRASVGYLVKRAHSLMLDMLEPVFEEQGFTFVQYVILAWLREGIAVNPRDICVQYRHDSGAMTRVIDQLAERNLVRRVRGDRDRRKVELQLTPAGHRAAEQLIPLIVGRLNVSLSYFTKADIQELERLLAKLNTRMQSELNPFEPVAMA